MKISYSARNTYSECSFKYFLHYMLKLRETQEKSAFGFGAAIDAGLNSLLETRNLVEAQNVFVNQWSKFKDLPNIKYTKADLEEHLLTDDQLTLSTEEKSWYSLKAKGLIILEEYKDQVLPKIKEVIKVQFDDYLTNEQGDKLNVKPDLICVWEDGRRLLVDNKTSSIKYDEDSVANSEQLATYFEALKDEYKLDACAFFVMPKKINKKKKPQIAIDIIIDQVKEETIEATFEQYQHALDGIKNAKFEKNFEACQSKFGRCHYYDYCRTGSKVGLKEKEE